MNVIGYIRVSTQGQAKDGYSLAYQEDEIKGTRIHSLTCV
ncbi:hypothetical protein FB379_1762 [Aeribacillus composti]|nr:hypothetical protein FB379_1762 [Aeribacillus composti]